MIEEFGNGKHDGGVSDTALIGLVGSAFDEGRRGREAPDVMARGRALRRRKRAVPALGALGIVAVAASLAVALSGPSGAGSTTNAGAAHSHSLTADGTAVNVDNAAFSVHTDAKTGNVTVTIRQFIDEGELKQALAKAGIRTVFDSVTVHPNSSGAVPAQPCTWTGATPVPAVSADDVPVLPGKHDTIVIDRSKLPSGSVLAILYEHTANVANGTSVGVQLFSSAPTGCTAN
jgi:hypothetical protein